MGRGRAHDWNDGKIATIMDLREKGASYSAISREIGSISKESVRQKVRELVEIGAMPDTAVSANGGRVRAPVGAAEDDTGTTTGGNSWSEEDVAILTEGYTAGDDMTDIVKRLKRNCTTNSAYVKASRLQLERGMRKRKSRRAPAKTRTDSRDRLMREVADILQEPLDRSRPDHLMVIMSVSADHCRRDLAETARLSLLPLPWVERVFGRLDGEGVWPVTDRTSDDLCPSDYERFAEICNEEIHNLDRMADGR